MGKKRRKGGGGGRSRLGGGSSGGSGGSGSDPFADATKALELFSDGLTGGVAAVADFAKSTVEGSAEFKRASAAAENLKEQLTFPALEGLANMLSPTLGNFVHGARGALGDVAAFGNASGELEDLSAQAAFAGMPLDKDLQSQLFPMLEARRQSVERARQQSADVTGEVLKSRAESASEYIGIGDIWRSIFSSGNARQP